MDWGARRSSNVSERSASVFVPYSTTMGAPHLPFPHRASEWSTTGNAQARTDSELGIPDGALRRTRHRGRIGRHPRCCRCVLDLVVYYEGGRVPARLHRHRHRQGRAATATGCATHQALLAQAAARNSALAARIRAAVMALTNNGRQPAEPTIASAGWKTAYEKNPDLAYPNLPVSLNVIQRDLDRKRPTAARQGGQ